MAEQDLGSTVARQTADPVPRIQIDSTGDSEGVVDLDGDTGCVLAKSVGVALAVDDHGLRVTVVIAVGVTGHDDFGNSPGRAVGDGKRLTAHRVPSARQATMVIISVAPGVTAEIVCCFETPLGIVEVRHLAPLIIAYRCDSASRIALQSNKAAHRLAQLGEETAFVLELDHVAVTVLDPRQPKTIAEAVEFE